VKSNEQPDIRINYFYYIIFSGRVDYCFILKSVIFYAVYTMDIEMLIFIEDILNCKLVFLFYF